jgi:hypothetical protein
LCNAAPIRYGRGRITGGLIARRDMTQRKMLEQKLIETAKLESLGVLAGGIAHDFGNLLTGVLGNASLLEDDLPRSSPDWSYGYNIALAAERAARLTRQMPAYSGRRRFVIERVNLSQYIRQMAGLLHSSMPMWRTTDAAGTPRRCGRPSTRSSRPDSWGGGWGWLRCRASFAGTGGPSPSRASRAQGPGSGSCPRRARRRKPGREGDDVEPPDFFPTGSA